MRRFFASNNPEMRARAVFWLAEITAGCAFVILMIALLCAPYLLGLLPELDAEFMRGAR